MTTPPTAQPVATQPGPPESSLPTRPDPLLRRPRSVAMPNVALVARFDSQTAERITAWQGCYQRALTAVHAADDAAPGGRDHVVAIESTARAVREALVTGQEVDESAHVELLAAFLRDEPPTRLARAVVEVTKADVILNGLLADVATDVELRDRVDEALEQWVGRACHLVDSDAPGAIEQTEQANAAEWRPLAGLLAWLTNPRAPYRLRDRRTTDARLAEALAMHALRNGRPLHELPYRGSAANGIGAPGGFEPTGRYDPAGRVLVQASMPTPPLAIGPPPPELPPMEAKARNRWGWLSA